MLYGPFTDGPDLIWQSCPPVRYPLETQLTTEGATGVSVFVHPDGTPKDIELFQTSGSTLLDQTILAELSACRFKPRTIDDVPVAGRASVTMRFGNRAKWWLPEPGSR